MGTGGMVADAFANLIRIMWSESYNFYSPVMFRVRNSSNQMFFRVPHPNMRELQGNSPS
jgi:hypothetical protein